MDIDRKPDFINEEGTKWRVDVSRYFLFKGS